MGLGLVEMLYRVEEKFEIVVSDEDAEKMRTPRDVIDYLMSQPKVIEKWSREYISITVRQFVEDQSGIYQEDFTDDSRFIEDLGMD